ncbi:Geranylgeranyl transferase type-2 subunit alpha [Beauveria bassiana]|nr:Geranylgeranyl transferase type-2 subunit alpha [Beauveria bassiana]
MLTWVSLPQHGVARTSRVCTAENRLQNLKKIEIYRDLEKQIQTQVALGNYNLAVFQLTTQLLRLNPEYYTIWNIRRRCLLYTVLSRSEDQPASNAQDDRFDEKQQDSDESSLQSELSFTVPLLIKSPKCYWIWNYRWWILHKQFADCPFKRPVRYGRLLDRDQRNFHAWGYRRSVVSMLESPELRGKSLAQEEFAFTTRMIGRNLSNFSAWHHRSQLFLKVIAEQNCNDEARAAFLRQELDTVREGLNLGPEDQSLWYYHQFLTSQIVKDGDRDTIAPALTVAERVAYMKHEIYEIKDLLEDYINVK